MDSFPALAAAPVVPPALLASWCRRLHAQAAVAGVATPGLAPSLDALVAHWTALWTRHAGDPSGWPQYRALLKQAAARLGAVPAGPQPASGASLRTALTGLLRAAVPAPGRAVPGHARPAVQPALPAAMAPLFVLGTPMAGAPLLLEALSLSASAWTRPDEGEGAIGQVPGLAAAARAFESERLASADADPATVDALRTAFAAGLRDRGGCWWQGAPPAPLLVDEDMRHALRAAFLAAVFPQARFVLVLREPLATVAAMLDAWRAGTRVSHARLPGWGGGRWSLPLVHGWRDLEGQSLVQVAVHQYLCLMQALQEDLSALAPERTLLLPLEDLLSRPRAALAAVAHFAGLDTDGMEAWVPPEAALAAAIAPGNAEALQADAARLQAADRALRGCLQARAAPAALDGSLDADQASAAPATAPALAAAALPAMPAGYGYATPAAASPGAGAAGDFSRDPRLKALASVHTRSFAEVLERAGASLLVSTYQAGKLVLVRHRQGTVDTGFKELRKPMGIARRGAELAVGTAGEVRLFADVPAAAARLRTEARPDALYVPRASHFTGNIDIHEMAYADDGLWIVNTRFCCLCTLDPAASFVPRWKPPFLSALAAEDRCHLNGLAVRDGRVRYVTMLGRTDTPGGWRANKASGGLLMDLDGERIVCEGLSMPHSPRWYRDRLWVLESGTGGLCRVDPDTGRRETVAELPGFTRGLDFLGPLAFIGLSQVRESAVFAKLPLTERLQERACGVWVVHIERGEVLGFLRFEQAVQEIFAVTVLPGLRLPELALPGEPVCADTFVLPDAALAEVPGTRPAASHPPSSPAPGNPP